MLKKREVDTGESPDNNINNQPGSSLDDSENEIRIEFEDESGEKDYYYNSTITPLIKSF